MNSIIKSIWLFSSDVQRLLFYIACCAIIIAIIQTLEYMQVVDEFVASIMRVLWYFSTIAIWIDWPRLARQLRITNE